MPTCLSEACPQGLKVVPAGPETWAHHLLPANCCWLMQGFFIFIRAVKTLTQHNKGVVVVRQPAPLHQPTWQLCMGCCRLLQNLA